MATALVEIALELAHQYPKADADSISQTIIKSIESGETLSEIIRAVKLPDRQQTLNAALRSRRLKEKQARRVQDKLEFIRLFRRAQAKYASLTEYTTSSQPFMSDGSKTVLDIPLRLPDSADLGMMRRGSPRPNVTVQVTDISEWRLADDQWVKPITEVPVTSPTIVQSDLYSVTTALLTIEISYVNRRSVEALLGGKGKLVLQKMLIRIQESTMEHNWPLVRVGVSYVEDAEVRDWRYVLVVLVFDCTFDIAEKYLHDFYDELDILSNQLSTEEQDILRSMLHLDVATAI